MKKILFTLAMGGLFTTSLLKAQVVLEALDAPDAYAVPVGVTLNGGETFFASIYDNDYLPYTQPSAPATWNRPINAGGGNDQLIDYQGSITTVGINVYIPITSTGNTTLPAFNQQISIPAEYTEDGISRVVELSWEAQYVTSATKNIAATVKAIGGTLNIKKLDLNGGLGNDFKGVLLGRFTYPSTNAGTSDTTYDLRVLSGIPDRKFGEMTSITANNVTYLPPAYRHQFIYLPIMGPDGRMWLNNNLGAYYSDINSPYFNPMHQAGALDANDTPLANPTADQIKNDFRAAGSLFDFGRYADGLELVDRTANSASLRYDVRAFLPGPRVVDVNREVCPIGWHTPTAEELLNLNNVITNTNRTLDDSEVNSDAMFTESVLKLPLTGQIMPTFGPAFLVSYRNIGYYVSSTVAPYSNTPSRYYDLEFHKAYEFVGLYYPTRSYIANSDNGAIRCIKD